MKELIEQTLTVLKDIHAPDSLINERSALVLLALAGVQPNESIRKSTVNKLSIVGNKRGNGYPGIMQYLAVNFDKHYAENSRETIRRVDIHTMVQLGIVEKNANDKSIPTNSSKTHYSLIPEFVEVLRLYGTRSYHIKLTLFLEHSEIRNERYRAEIKLEKINVSLPSGIKLELSPGDHNELQGRIIESFLPIFAPTSKVLYLGDTSNKYLYLDKESLNAIGLDLSKSSHTKLPDVVLYDEHRKWLFFIEAVTSHGPIGNKRMHSLEQLSKNLDVGIIYVTAFQDRKSFRKFAADIAWESEVWIANDPHHMIHFNGDRFTGPRT